VSNREPRISKGWPSDHLVTAQRASRIEQPVDVERDAAAGEQLRQGREYRRLAGAGRPGDHKERLDRSRLVEPPARWAPRRAIVRLHHDRFVAGLAVMHRAEHASDLRRCAGHAEHPDHIPKWGSG
jgi:hypothetical protein